MAVVLVVEDEDQVRVPAESYLEEQGHQVLSAGTPAGAVDLLFTDLDLKRDIHAGIELAKAAVSCVRNCMCSIRPGERSPME
jgi:CheY-like chemotaxis protein